MKRRNFILLLGGASSGAMSVGTGAFSSVEAERSVEVNVVEDEEAYLGLEEGSGEGFVRIKNQFAGDLGLTVTAALPSSEGEVEIEAEENDEIEIEVESDGGDEKDGDDDSVSVDIPTGESANVTAECDEDGSLDLKLTFRGEVGETGTTVDKTRTFTVECEEDDDEADEDVTDEVEKVKFFGSAEKVRVLTTENDGGGNGSDGTVSAKLYCGDEGNTESESFETVHVNEDLWIDNFDDDDLEGPIAGVEVEGIGVFENPDPGSGNTVDEAHSIDDSS